MSLLYDEDQLAIASESRRVLEARTTPEGLLHLLEKQGEFHTPFWDTAKEQGWTALTLPERFGGLDLSLVELGLIALQAGRSLSGAPFLTSSFGAARAIIDHGDEAIRQVWLPKLASGDAIGAVAFGEGQDVLGTSASFSDGLLTGIKAAVSAGLHADVVVVLANEGGEAVLVVAAVEGVSREVSVRCKLVSTWRSAPSKHKPQVISDCHSANAAERRSLYVWRSTRWRSELKWLWSDA